jgi:hypothetical protein
MADGGWPVFLNVPFDRQYQKLPDALVFAVHACARKARCARELDDGAQVRIEKLYKIIGSCRFGIHDLSRTSLDPINRLPRFNMPLELGVFPGARRFGTGEQSKKRCLIPDRDRHRYQRFCSDIAGQDISAHHNDVATALRAVRNWLQTHLPASHRLPTPPGSVSRYVLFRRQLPLMCRASELDPADLTFIDYRRLAAAWLDENAERSR